MSVVAGLLLFVGVLLTANGAIIYDRAEFPSGLGMILAGAGALGFYSGFAR